MDISIALKLLYYIIILLPALVTLKYLLVFLYNLKMGTENNNKNLLGFLWGILSITSYSITVLFINKSMVMSNTHLLNKFFYPFVLILLGIIYTIVIEDRDKYTSGKIQALLCMPLLTGLMLFLEKILR